jgi:hypothetical protein
MSDVHDSNCYFDGKRSVSGEIICLSQFCMICKDGRWEETARLTVL